MGDVRLAGYAVVERGRDYVIAMTRTLKAARRRLKQEVDKGVMAFLAELYWTDGYINEDGGKR